MTTTTICAGCGATVATGARFCPQCQHAAAQLRALREQERKRREQQVLFALFVLLLLAGYYFLR